MFYLVLNKLLLTNQTVFGSFKEKMRQEIKEVELGRTVRLGSPKGDKVKSIIGKITGYNVSDRAFRNRSLKILKQRCNAVKRAHEKFEFHV